MSLCISEYLEICEGRCPPSPEDNIQSSTSGITDEPPNKHAGKQTKVLCKSSMHC